MNINRTIKNCTYSSFKSVLTIKISSTTFCQHIHNVQTCISIYKNHVNTYIHMQICRHFCIGDLGDISSQICVYKNQPYYIQATIYIHVCIYVHKVENPTVICVRVCITLSHTKAIVIHTSQNVFTT